MESMTRQEREAVEQLALAWNALLNCVSDAQDRQEACVHIHALQRIIMSQPTIRSHPDIFRQR